MARPVFGQREPGKDDAIPAAYMANGAALYKCDRCPERSTHIIMLPAEGKAKRQRQLCQWCYYVDTNRGEEWPSGDQRNAEPGSMLPLFEAGQDGQERADAPVQGAEAGDGMGVRGVRATE